MSCAISIIVICAIFVFSVVESVFAVLHKPVYRPDPISYLRFQNPILPYGLVVRTAVSRVVLQPAAPLSVPDITH